MNVLLPAFVSLQRGCKPDKFRWTLKITFPVIVIGSKSSFVLGGVDFGSALNEAKW
jgi:hypothetical protein